MTPNSPYGPPEAPWRAPMRGKKHDMSLSLRSGKHKILYLILDAKNVQNCQHAISALILQKHKIVEFTVFLCAVFNL